MSTRLHLYSPAFLLFFVLATPSVVHAAGIEHASIVDKLGDKVLVKKTTFTEELWFTCFVSTRICTATASSSASIIPETLREINKSISPDGTRVVITSMAASTIYPTRMLLSINSDGSTLAINTLPQIPDVRRILWTDDSDTILFLTTSNEIQKYSVSKNAFTSGGSIPFGSSWITPSPDGRYVAYYIAGTQIRGQRTFGVLDTTLGKTWSANEPLGYWDLLTEGIRIFTFSPDSKTLLYISDKKNFPTLYQVKLASLPSQETNLPAVKMFSREYTVADMRYKDNNTLLFVANRENPYQWSLYEYTISTGVLKRVADNISFAENLEKVGSNYLLAIADDKGVYPGVYDPALKKVVPLQVPVNSSLPTKGKAVKLLNKLNGVFLLESSKNSDNLIVWLHGGPFRQTSTMYHPYLSYDGYDWVLETARQSDIGVLKIDYPGSAGYGRLFAESLTGNVGVKDAKDVASAVADFAKRNRYKNVYLMGNSYGGYLVLKLITDKPASYKGALSVAGVTDWGTMLNKLDTSIFNAHFKGTPGEDNWQLYANASIHNGISRLNGQKIILMHGNMDNTISFKQSQDLATALAAINKPAELITMEGEDHVFRKPGSFTKLCETVLTMVGADPINLNRCVL